MARNGTERQERLPDKRALRGFAHSALKKALDNPTRETYTEAYQAVDRAKGPIKAEGSGFSNTLRTIRGKFYDAWMGRRDISTLSPNDYEIAYTQLTIDESPEPEFNRGYSRIIGDTDRELLGYLTSLQKGTSDMTLFFTYVAAIEHSARAFDYQARAERARILGDPQEKEYVEESQKASDSARAIAQTMTSREKEGESYRAEFRDVKDLFENMYSAERQALLIDPRVEMTTRPETIKNNTKLVLESEVNARALASLFEKLDTARRQFQETERDTTSLPDLRLLTVGAKDEFAVEDVSVHGHDQTPYSGILQQAKDIFGYALPVAPALVVYAENNGIVLVYGNNIIFTNPAHATRGEVAQALALAYGYNGNDETIMGSEKLWDQENNLRNGVENELLEGHEIGTKLSQEIFSTGAALWFDIKATSTKEEAKRKIASIVSGGESTELPKIAAEGHYLEEKLENVYTAQELLLQAQEMQLKNSSLADTIALFQQARTLQVDARVPLGLYYVQSVMGMIDTITNHIYNKALQTRTKTNMIHHLFQNPPQTIDELLRPEYTMRRIVTDLDIGFTSYAKKVYTSPEKKRNAAVPKESSYPFKNLNRIVHWAENVHISSGESDDQNELHVPYYYHGTFSPVITPAVLDEYAILMGDRFPEGTAARVREALFGMFEQMDSDVALQRRGNEPAGYSRWNQMNLNFIRFLNTEKPINITSYRDVSLTYATGGLMEAASTELLRTAQMAPEERETHGLGTPLLHEKLLYDWFFSDNPSIAKLGKTVNVGILLSSIQNALTNEALTGPDGLLPEASDQAFLQSLVEFIPESHTPQEYHVFPKPRKEQDVTVVEEGKPSYGERSLYADLPPQSVMTLFEQSFPFVEHVAEIAALATFGDIYGIETPDGIDPIITHENLYNYSGSRKSTAARYGQEEASSALFGPFRAMRENYMDYLEKKDDEYPEEYRKWKEATQNLGFVVFAERDEGNIWIRYGYRLSHLVRAMSDRGNSLGSLPRITPRAQTFTNQFLTDLAYTMHEREIEEKTKQETKSSE